MRLYINSILRFTHNAITFISLWAILCGCTPSFFEEEGDCEPVHIVRFNYDMNMKFADAFHAEVPSVDLYVFDMDGRLVTSVSRQVAPDESRDFSIELRDIPSGHYSLLAWCGVKDSEHFRVNPEEIFSPEMHHHICRMHRENDSDEGSAHIRKDVGRLFHGRLDNVDMTQEEGSHLHIVDLTKDTNVVRVTLQHLSGKPMNADDYDISVTDANGLYDHNNDLLPDEVLTYHPWSLKGGTASFLPEDQPTESSRAQESVSAVVSELTVGRLMADRNKDAILTVRNSHTGDLILSIPLIDYLLLVKGHYYSEDGFSPMSDQEYLDRQDDYPLTFFLDESGNWIKTVIYINSWRVVINDSTLH